MIVQNNLPPSQVNQNQSDHLLVDLRNALAKMYESRQTNEENQKKNEINAAIAEKKQEEAQSTELKNLRSQISRKTIELKDARKQLEEQEDQINNNYRRQFRHLSDTLVEKQAEIQYLNKQVLTLKNRITSLQQDLNQSNMSRKSLEQTLNKTVQLIKFQFKELFDAKEEEELTRFMSETNIKQINDKLEALMNICIELEKNKFHMEEKYINLRKEKNQLIQNNIKFEVQIEKLKEQLWQEQEINNSYKKNKKDFSHWETDYFAKKSKSSRLSKVPSQMQSQQENKNKQKTQNANQEMEQTISLLKVETAMLLNLEEKLLTLNQRIDHDTDIWRQVLIVKQMNSAIQFQLNELKCKENPEYGDQLLNEKHPNLYQYFKQKMQQVQQFQKRFQDLQKTSHKIAQTLEKILYSEIPEQESGSSEKEIIERENAAKSKLKKELLQAFEIQKKSILKESQEYYGVEVQIFKDKIADLNQEISRLQDKNENLFNLLEESEKVNQKKSQPIEVPQKTEHNLSEVQSISPKNDTQSIFGLDPSQISRLNFLEQKVDRLEEQLKESTKKIESYKKEIRRMLEAYKLKNTKHKYQRCTECMLGIDSDDDNVKCPKCKSEIHEGECRRMHEKTCKKNPATNNKPRQKKPDPKPSVFSQSLDYF